MRGISAIIVVILVLMIVIALVALMYMFSSGIFTATTSSATQSINQTTKALFTNMKIEGVNGNRIFIRNLGQSDLTDFKIYIGDTSMDYEIDKLPLPPGEMTTIKIKQIDYEDPPESGNWYHGVPPGDIKITTGTGLTSTYKQYSYASVPESNNAPVVASEQSFIDFTEPVKGFKITATVSDADGLNDIVYCGINYRRENDIMASVSYYKDSMSNPTEVIYNSLDGSCTFNITSLDTSPVYWSNYAGTQQHHSLTLDNDYIYTVDQLLVVRKYNKATGNIERFVDMGAGTYGRGMSSDADFLYFGDSNFNLTKVRKSDLQRNLTIKYGTTTTYDIYTTAVDDTGVYWGNRQYNISKVNKTNLAQILWSADYGGAFVYDIDIDSEYLYAVDSLGNITKINKTSVGTAQQIWSIRPNSYGRYSIVVDGGYLWVGDSKSTLWQINKVDGSVINSTNYTPYYGSPSIYMYEITFDDNFIYFSDNTGSVQRVNKISKDIENWYSLGGNTFAFGCDATYCYASPSSAIYSFFKDANVGNYSTSESILSYGMMICDYYGYYYGTTPCAYPVDAAHIMP